MDLLTSVKHDIINLINVISKTVNYYNDLVIKRTRKIKLADILYLLVRKTATGNSFDKMICEMQIYKYNSASKQAFIKKRSVLPDNLFLNINDTILKEVIYKTNKPRIIAVDGTNIVLDKKLNKFGFKFNSKENYCTALISCMYDVKTHIPINYTLVTHNNERKAFIDDQLKYVNEGDIIIFDRGYYSDELIKILSEKGIKFIFRIKNEYKMTKQLIKENKDEINYNVKVKKVNYPVRCIKYNIDLVEDEKKSHYKYPKNGTYYVCTNLNNTYNISDISILYHDRWSIETDFRFSKYDLSLSEITSKTLSNVKQDIQIHNFILIIAGYIYTLISKLNKALRFFKT